MTKQQLLQKMQEAKDRIISKMKVGQVGYIRVDAIACRGEDFFLDGKAKYYDETGGSYSVKIERAGTGFRLFSDTLDDGDIEDLASLSTHSEGTLPVEIV